MKTAGRARGVPESTIRRHRDTKVEEPGVIKVGPKSPTLNPAVEMAIYNHLKRMEAALFGLTTVDAHRLAYSVAEKLGVRHPFSHATKMAGYDWLRGFLTRHPDLSVRIPQATNLARAVGFNRVKVAEFFQAYRGLLGKHTFTESKISYGTWMKLGLQMSMFLARSSPLREFDRSGR